MALNFEIHKSTESYNTKVLAKDSATVLVGGRFCALTAGLATVADATSTALAYVVADAGVGETEVTVIADDTTLFSGTADAAFAVTNRGTEVDLVLSWDNQLIDLGASVTDVFKVLPSTDAGTVGETTEVRVKLNKPLI